MFVNMQRSKLNTKHSLAGDTVQLTTLRDVHNGNGGNSFRSTTQAHSRDKLCTGAKTETGRKEGRKYFI